jgi:hypothetical protein
MKLMDDKTEREALALEAKKEIDIRAVPGHFGKFTVHFENGRVVRFVEEKSTVPKVPENSG